MAETKGSPTEAASAPLATPKPAKRNPALRMLGIPSFRFKLPSRNWLIFLSVSGTFASFLLYDRYQKKRAQRKWCTLVSHLSREPLDVRLMPRKVTVFLSAPPGDGLKAPRDHFNEYVKPILVAGALEWEVVEGRREGEVRAGLAEKIRKWRRKNGESAGVSTDTETEPDVEDLVGGIRSNLSVREWDGVQGDVIIGRHTWKEYVRGLHEGWLGPLQPPPESPPPTSEETASATNSSDLSDETTSADEKAVEKPASTEPSKPTKPAPAAPFITVAAYSSTPSPPSLPPVFDPSTPIPLPHLLGFLNTPIRIYRFLNRRHVAEEVGRETAAAVLAAQTRPYNAFLSSDASSPFSDQSSSDSSPSFSPSSSSSSSSPPIASTNNEVKTALVHEERDWTKSAKKRADGDESERVWLDDVVLDPRIVERMLRFQLSDEDQHRAKRIDEGKEAALDEGREGETGDES
ncbi:MAG: mitochondrial import inner membrane translocase subunit tim54 [Thelocarpon superellum]|nr:MAG: mitochondrial import inner membrane translocase subunit tim54 [Thelocarpon superellum]